MQRILAIADDLSGAAETAAAFLAGTGELLPGSAQSAQPAPFITTASDDGAPLVCLLPRLPEELASALSELWPDGDASGAGPLVLDTDNRRFPAEEAAARLRLILESLTAGEGSPAVFLKIDSLLRGPIASQLAVLAETGPVILAPALPPLGRSTVNGTVHHQGVPLHETTLWHAEPSAPPATITEALAPLPTALVDLAAVRSGTTALRSALATATAGHPYPVVICDAVTTADLDAIAAAALSLPGIRFAGASALGAALSPTAGQAIQMRPTSQRPDGVAAVVPSLTSELESAGFPLLVVGSASASAREQVLSLAADGVAVVALSPADLLDGTADSAALKEALAAGPAAVTVDASAVDPATSSRIAAAFARAVAPLSAGRPLMLTGGETARTVLGALGVGRLRVLGEIEHGAVLSLTPGGSPVVTRPGSFGNASSLRTILAALTGHRV